MIAEIGIMVGLYIITRMVSYLTRKSPAEPTIVRVLAIITIIATIIVVIDMFLRGTSPTL